MTSVTKYSTVYWSENYSNWYNLLNTEGTLQKPTFSWGSVIDTDITGCLTVLGILTANAWLLNPVTITAAVVSVGAGTIIPSGVNALLQIL